MVFGALCIGLGEFLTFAAMVLAILGQIGQLSNNIVARNIRMAQITTIGTPGAPSNSLQDALNVGNLFAQDQAALELAGNGIKQRYEWGLYNFCAGDSQRDARSCTDHHFGHKFQPLPTLEADASADNAQAINQSIPSDSTFANTDYLSKYSQAAFWLLFIGTILSGLSFLVGFAAHRFAFLLAAILALLSALLIGVGAAIWTAISVRTANSLKDVAVGLTFHYGNALWFYWGAFVGEALAIVPFILSCCAGRRAKNDI
ncbi:unnamed protein product [Tilletia controversa]|uniref:Uncharacterized protein n=3 Tax=Tilletia TaxID=13289 RepID=A0A8X7SVK0_9BASI|nr:hypothetical protein CF336_g4008 [Tilletia laevis]KAE8198084.1 hypothetical protein CF328_g3653 [Tilletia controversa]KAE8258364.1 hypothetical protein A4X03_0g4405 [Tilletia caries]KAE8197728.1 hypothetical protein CF335_g4546 [Tilletia laevis]KAE8245257.1 hypothetical protein A4X06_0g5762 [Tilletia controversa]